MPVGTSNKIVIEVDPKLKQELYAKLKSQGLTMREWFLRGAERELQKNNKKG